jgi:hypothetical protein
MTMLTCAKRWLNSLRRKRNLKSIALENGTKGMQIDSASHYPNNGKIIRGFNGYCFAATSNRWLAAIA